MRDFRVPFGSGWVDYHSDGSATISSGSTVVVQHTQAAPLFELGEPYHQAPAYPTPLEITAVVIVLLMAIVHATGVVRDIMLRTLRIVLSLV